MAEAMAVAEWGTEEGVPGLKDARDGMNRSAGDCQDLQGDALPGANSYFWGEYEGDAAQGWFGTEKFYVFANDTLKDQGGEDCEVTWIVTAPAAVVGQRGVVLAAEAHLAARQHRAHTDHTPRGTPRGMNHARSR